ncbi:hypothetical protein [Cyclobacterium jeungdonense]|uniref:Uncharacterized protein n=1 Tax=Cyclobacterium jeungdonense TaxID=708087 RepID=A0ABT8CDH7_9BACT|nr:hypothetical protein [Cyclobacterium jeungdonense]MDN3689838.1 hypothetical protein [Cyclobacterium jeungdonense]
MKRLTGILKYTLAALFFSMVQIRYVLAQAGEESVEEYPLNPSPLRVVLYILLSFIVIAVVFKLLYKPKKKPNP